MLHYLNPYRHIILLMMSPWRLIDELHAVADTALVPTYTDPLELLQAMQGLHMRDMLGYDDDDVDEDGVNGIDITRMVHNDEQ